MDGDDGFDGYVRDQSGSLQAYVPEKPAQTRMFDPNRELPDVWKPVW
jgi:hypothetical protein